MSGSGKGDGHCRTEFLHLLGELRDLVLSTVTAGDPVRAEVSVADWRAVGAGSGDDVPVGDQDVVADRANRLERAAPTPDPVIPGTQVGVLRAASGLGCLGQGTMMLALFIAGIWWAMG